jgi:DNA-binding NarL/FixJ family response regulator
MMPTGKITLAIVESNRLYREFIMSLLNRETEFCIDGFRTTAELTAFSKPHVVLAQCDTPEFAQVKDLLKTQPGVKLAILNADPEQKNLLTCIRVGVAGFILKDADAVDVVDTIRAVSIGHKIIPPSIAVSICRQLYEEKSPSNGASSLVGAHITVREQQILNLMIDGLTNKEVAQKLNIATHTVKSHVHNLFQKLEIRNRVDLVTSYWKANLERVD